MVAIATFFMGSAFAAIAATIFLAVRYHPAFVNHW